MERSFSKLLRNAAEETKSYVPLFMRFSISHTLKFVLALSPMLLVHCAAKPTIAEGEPAKDAPIPIHYQPMVKGREQLTVQAKGSGLLRVAEFNRRFCREVKAGGLACYGPLTFTYDVPAGRRLENLQAEVHHINHADKTVRRYTVRAADPDHDPILLAEKESSDSEVVLQASLKSPVKTAITLYFDLPDPSGFDDRYYIDFVRITGELAGP